MTKFLLMGLMAATALVPASAMAQDRGDRPAREAREGNRSGWQRERPQPQRNYQNERPQQARPQAPQRNYQGERPQQRQDVEQRQERPAGAEQPRGDGQPRWRSGDRASQNWRDDRRDRPDGSAVLRPGVRPDLRDNDGRPGGSWEGRDRRPDERFDRKDRRPIRGYDRNDGWRNPGRDRQNWNDRRNWSRGWRTDNRYDWNRYRQTNRNVYRLPRYYPPSGYHYGYQRFSVGLTVGSMLYGSSYWINDPYSYRLPPAYGPYRWVRYYNDALLVDLETGEVVDTVYDLFW